MIPLSNRRVIVIAGAFLFLEWTWFLLGSPSQADIFASLQSTAGEDIFDYLPVQSNAIKDICAATEWNDDLIFTCENNAGTMAEIKNSVLTCVRFSISAGARLVLPRIILPSTDGSSKIDASAPRTDLSYLFDQSHFLKSLHLSCPQLHVFLELDSIPNLAGMHDPLELHAEDLQSHDSLTGIPHPETWSADFHAWLASSIASRIPPRGTSIVNLARSPPIYPVSSDESYFPADFGVLLKPRADVRKLATTTFFALISKYDLETPDLSGIAKNAYLGAYIPPDFPEDSYAALSKRILNQTAASDLSVVYLSSTAPATGKRLASTALPLGIRVATKYELLSEADVAVINALAPEQQSLVDFLVLRQASQFAGVSGSAFVWSVALGRKGKWRQDGGGGIEGEVMRDSLSRIYGEGGGDEGFATCLWP